MKGPGSLDQPSTLSEAAGKRVKRQEGKRGRFMFWIVRCYLLACMTVRLLAKSDALPHPLFVSCFFYMLLAWELGK
jgi:hypothetical protein